MRVCASIFLAMGSFAGYCQAASPFDVVVMGATPGGIAAAITAARLGHSVALVEYHAHLGGMSASGLSGSDIDTREAVGGLFNEFISHSYNYYVARYGANSEDVKKSRYGYHFEPSVAETIFNGMVAAEPRISVFRSQSLVEVIRRGKTLTGARFRDRITGKIREFRGQVFLDATYEGDLAAWAGAAYRLGRESRAEFDELHAGVVFQNWRTKTFLAGTTGEGDRGIQAYTYRMCLSDDPANGVDMTSPPPEYDRSLYAGYIDDYKSGRLDSGRQPYTMLRAMSVTEGPNHKFDINIRAVALSYPFVDLNHTYPEANEQERERISRKIRNITLGLLYFLQNDSQVPEEHRKLARRYRLAKDEFTDNGNFPWQLYVREARRIIGEYTLTENDVMPARGMRRPPIHADSVSAGEYPIDSMPVHKVADETNTILEGYLLRMKEITRPYQIPYRIMVPREVEGLLVPVAASATHVAFSSIRLEPTWMALGQAAGAAAHLAITEGSPLRAIPIERLQRQLLQYGQVLTYFRDIDHRDPAYAAMQFLGTKGFFPDYLAQSKDPVTKDVAAEWAARTAKLLGRERVDLPIHEGTTRGQLATAIFGMLGDAGIRMRKAPGLG